MFRFLLTKLNAGKHTVRSSAHNLDARSIDGYLCERVFVGGPVRGKCCDHFSIQIIAKRR
jgi:hypothetical protein